jgi:hypothetical protein
MPFAHADQLIEIHKQLLATLPAWMTARNRELWAPLMAVASLVDQQSDLDISDDLLGLARESIAATGLSFEAENILAVLETRIDACYRGDPDTDMSNFDPISGIMRIHPERLREELEALLGRRLTAEWVATQLRALGFRRARRDKHGAVYEVSKTQIDAIRANHTGLGKPSPSDQLTSEPTSVLCS